MLISDLLYQFLLIFVYSNIVKLLNKADNEAVEKNKGAWLCFKGETKHVIILAEK